MCIFCSFIKKMAIKQNELKKRVYEYWEKYKEYGKLYVVSHFVSEGSKRSTIYDMIQDAENKKPLERKKGSGRPVKIATPANIIKLVKMFDHKSGRSQKQAAIKLKTTQQNISKILKTKTNVKRLKKRKKPLRNANQERVLRPKCKKLVARYRNYQFILDDESYFTLNHSTLAGNDVFYTSDINMTADNVKYAKKAKYEQKIMVWIAISPMGTSNAYFVPSKMAVNQKVYLKKCIQERLMPFIRKHHQHTQTVFWPDLASSHYANSVQNYLRDENVEFVPKEDNPAAAPEVRPIEDFWADLKRSVYSNDWKAKNVNELKARIKYCLRKMDANIAKTRANETLPRLRKVARYGL